MYTKGLLKLYFEPTSAFTYFLHKCCLWYPHPGGTWILRILRILAFRQYSGYWIPGILQYCTYNGVCNTDTRAVLRILVSMYCGYSSSGQPDSGSPNVADPVCIKMTSVQTFSGLYHGMGLLGTFACMCGQLETHFRCG